VTTVDRINELRAKRATQVAEVEALDAEIAQLVRQAIDEGTGPTELAKAIGITRARIYQIAGRTLS
jgi:DNA invertase Pin-like site-specific DNA recombinase